MRPRVCPVCTKAMGEETRHKAGRLCSLVQAERRREKNPERRAYDAKRKAAQRKAGSDGSS